jgi:hypothetical protein
VPEIVLRRRVGRGSVSVDGTLVAEGDVPKDPAVLAVRCVAGRAGHESGGAEAVDSRPYPTILAGKGKMPPRLRFSDRL